MTVDEASRSYHRQMIRYYDGPKYSFDWDDVRQSYVDDESNLTADRQRIVTELHDTFSGRNVLEIASGGGRWTAHIAQTAESVLATDTSGQVLNIGRSLVTARNVKFLQCDAFDSGKLEGSFDAAFHFNFINHVPYSDWSRLLEQIHSKLDPGSVVVMGGQLYRGSESHDGLNYHSEYDCSDGVHYKLIDNIPDEAQVASLVGHLVKDLEFSVRSGWWARYSVP